MIEHYEFQINTTKYIEFIPINDVILNQISNSKIKDGMIFINTKHTTTGVSVNEKLECIEYDIKNTLKKIAPEDGNYFHNRFLKSYGAMANNPTGHIKSALIGSSVQFPFIEGELKLGAAQEIYFMEFDGAQERNISITIIGE